MYDEWKTNPESVHASWRAYFNGIESGAEEPYQAPPNIGRDTSSGGGDI